MAYHPNLLLRRGRAVRAGLAAVFAALLLAFFQAQVLQNADFLAQAEKNRLREVPLPAARAIITDRRGEIIAENLPGYTVSLLAPSTDSLRAALVAVSRVVPLDAAQREQVVRRFRRSPMRPAVIFTNASFETISALEERRSAMPGLIIQSVPRRFYPDGPALAAVLGYTSEISEQQLALPRYEGYKPGQQVGKTGLEAQYEEQLRGQEGSRFVEVDARNRVVRDAGVRAEVRPQSPQPLKTNLDLDLQRFVHAYFGDSLRGAVVAMDPATGGVLALYSAPSYDINRFIGGMGSVEYDSLRTAPHDPLFNRALGGTYAPASTWKLATAVLGLEMGLVTMDTRMPQPCTGGYYLGRVFRCWDKKGHGNVTLAQAIAKSCDVYFYQLGLKIGLSNLLAGGVRLGFNQRTGVDLPGEKRPFWPQATEYFTRRYGPRGWNRSVVLSLAIGQADNTQTPLSMARFYTALATDGMAATPQVVASAPQRTRLLSLTAEQLAGVKAALADVVQSGTAAGAQVRGLTIAGKTGTAQNPPYKDNAWFVGYAPADAPRIVVAIIIEEGLHGSAAARVATRIMERYLHARLTMGAVPTD